MPAITLPVGSLIYIDNATSGASTYQKLTEHNRSPVGIDINRIEKSERMSNGTLRKLHIADKKMFSVSWSMVPSFSTMTVDGGWGAIDLRTFYQSAKGKETFKIKISYNGNSQRDEEYTVSFTSCNFTVVKRNVKDHGITTPQEFWDVSIAMEEV